MYKGILSLTLALSSGPDGLARTGAVMAVFAIAMAAPGPLKARLIDRYGAPRVLPPLAAGYAGGLGVLAVLTWRPGASSGVLEVVAAATAVCAPPLGPTMRTFWRVLTDGRPELMQRAFGLDTVAEEVIGVGGPLLVGGLILVMPAAGGVAMSAGLVAVGTMAMSASPVARAAGRGGENAVQSGGSGAEQAGQPRKRGLLSRIVEPVLVTAACGLALGAMNLAVVAFAMRHHRPAAVAWVEAALAVGSVVGGLAHGAVSWRVSQRGRLSVAAAGLGVAVATAALCPDPYSLTAVALVAGLFVSPLLTLAYLVADELAPADGKTGAGIWVNNSFNVGSSGGYAAMGPVLGRVSGGWGFALAAVPVLVSGVPGAGRGLSVRLRRRGRR